MELIAWALIFILGTTASIALMFWDIARERYEDLEWLDDE
jgi:hypothetical protein